MAARTLYDKLVDAHVVRNLDESGLVLHGVVEQLMKPLHHRLRSDVLVVIPGHRAIPFEPRLRRAQVPKFPYPMRRPTP